MDLLGSVTKLAGTVLSGPVKDYNNFMGMITGAIQDPLGSVGDVATALGMKNPYAMQNTLSMMQRRGDPVLSFEWLAVIVDPNPVSALPWYYIDTLTTPGLTVAQQDQHFNGLSKKYAGTMTVDSLQLGLFTDSAAATFSYANDWFSSTYRKDGFYSLPSQYKRDVILFVLDSKKNTVIDIRFVGCWPTNYNAYTWDAQNNVVDTQLTLSVDQVIFNTETSLTRAVDRFKNQMPGILTDVGASLLNIPSRR